MCIRDRSHVAYARQASGATQGGQTAGVPIFAPPTEAGSPARRGQHRSGFQSIDVSQGLGTTYDPQGGVSGSSHVGLSGVRPAEEAQGFDNASSAAVATAHVQLPSTQDGTRRYPGDFKMASGALLPHQIV